MSFKNALIALAIPALCAAVPTPPQVDNTNIVGGTAAVEGDFPFIVSLQQDGSHFCGGSLLDATTVVTAAHCSVDQDATTIKVRAGSLSRTTGGQLVQVKTIIPNPGYDDQTMKGDVGIFKLSSPITANGTIKYATLPAANFTPTAGTNLLTGGWGTTTEGGQDLPVDLLKVTVPVVDHKKCETDYSNTTVSQDQFCAGFDQGGKDSCQGDSGGPIVDPTSKVLVGLVSWGQGCAEAGKPGIYTDVGDVLDFIKSHMG